MSLCSRCQNFDIQAFGKVFPLRGYAFSDVIAGSSTGCNFCSLLMDAIGSHKICDESGRGWWSSITQPKKLSDMYNKWLQSRIYIHPEGPKQVHFWASKVTTTPETLGTGMGIVDLCCVVGRDLSRTGSVNDSMTIFHAGADPGTPAFDSGDVRGIIETKTTTWTQTRFRRIKHWHKFCRENHPLCNKTFSGARDIDVENAALPTRYLRIIVDGGDRSTNVNQGIRSSMIQWRLEESRGRKGRYIALSHRWSPDEEPLVTTKDNIECRLETCQHSPCTAREETPIARLFFEACVLCINLGIDKLWIDSVCIIQRDPEDWALEAVKMAEYYQFAWLTIATTHETFFGDPELPDLPRTARLPYRDQDGEQQGHFYLQAFTPSLVAQTYREKIEASSLFKRGWIFQERLLSRRILLITASSWGTFLECQNDCPMAMTGDFADPRRLRLHGIEMQANSVFQLEYLWKKAVVLYSELELGFIVKDRVVALAGIAAEFGEAFTRMLSKELSASTATTISFPQNCYAAGLWLSDKTCLCWEQSRVQSTTRISGIPTWSWASLMNKDGSSPCGISVEWPHIVERDYAFTMYRIEEAEMIRVDTTTWEPSYTQVSRCSPDTHSYGNDCRFAALKLHGCMVPISIGTRFTSEEAVIAARVSNHRPDFGRLNWRRVAADSESRVVAGWASVEHPDFQNDASCRSASFVAFVLMIAASGQGSLGMGSLWRSRRGYIVLYLREITGLRSNYTPCYERVGVGRLFEPELGKSIVPGAEKSIWLL